MDSDSAASLKSLVRLFEFRKSGTFALWRWHGEARAMIGANGARFKTSPVALKPLKISSSRGLSHLVNLVASGCYVIGLDEGSTGSAERLLVISTYRYSIAAFHYNDSSQTHCPEPFARQPP